MAQLTQINTGPYNYNWVGDVAMTPTYGSFSHLAADVNSSIFQPPQTNGITALDALLTNYRSVGILPLFWYLDNKAGVQNSPNFRVHGRMVPELTGKITNSYTGDTQLFNGDTWPEPFDANPIGGNLEDIAFIHRPDIAWDDSLRSYLYFKDARPLAISTQAMYPPATDLKPPLSKTCWPTPKK